MANVLLAFTVVYKCLGTGNGMVKSLLHSIGDPCTARNATLAIVRGLHSAVNFFSLSFSPISSLIFIFFHFVIEAECLQIFIPCRP